MLEPEVELQLALPLVEHLLLVVTLQVTGKNSLKVQCVTLGSSDGEVIELNQMNTASLTSPSLST